MVGAVANMSHSLVKSWGTPVLAGDFHKTSAHCDVQPLHPLFFAMVSVAFTLDARKWGRLDQSDPTQ